MITTRAIALFRSAFLQSFGAIGRPKKCSHNVGATRYGRRIWLPNGVLDFLELRYHSVPPFAAKALVNDGPSVEVSGLYLAYKSTSTVATTYYPSLRMIRMDEKSIFL